MGDKRNITKVAQHLSVCRASIGNWCREFSWQQRVKERDDKNAKALAKATDKSIVERDKKYIKIADAAIKIFAASLVGRVTQNCPKCNHPFVINVPKAKISAFDFNNLVRLVRLELGEADSRPEHKIIIEYRDPVPRAKPIESKEIIE